MIIIKYKNLERSEILRNAVHEKIDGLIEKFPDLAESRVEITLEMENSPFKAGPDLFTVKLHISRGRFSGITVKRSDANLYVAMAEINELMLERLNRFGDRARVKQRTLARKIQNQGNAS